jgi:hypothetical protein
MSEISRSVYQKVIQKNKGLLKDIKTLTSEETPIPERLSLIIKYRQRWERENNFISLLTEVAKKHKPIKL